MDALPLALVGVVVLATAGNIVGERRESRRIIWATKPVASLAFVALGVFAGPVGGPFGFAMLAALVLSFFGDLCLIPADRRVFRAGILLFLAAHVAFLVAFFAAGVSAWWVFGAAIPLTLALVVIARWILPKVPRELMGAVLAYMGVITIMVAAAAGAVGAGASPWLLVAAVAFYANDVLVARDRFVVRDWRHRLVGLPLYYGAMVAFALLTSSA